MFGVKLGTEWSFHRLWSSLEVVFVCRFHCYIATVILARPLSPLLDHVNGSVAHAKHIPPWVCFSELKLMYGLNCCEHVLRSAGVHSFIHLAEATAIANIWPVTHVVPQCIWERLHLVEALTYIRAIYIAHQMLLRDCFYQHVAQNDLPSIFLFYGPVCLLGPARAVFSFTHRENSIYRTTNKLKFLACQTESASYFCIQSSLPYSANYEHTPI